MARLPRLTVPGELHLIVQSSRRGQAALEDEADAAVYIRLLSQAVRATGVSLHAYGLRRHEVRLLATPDSVAALGQLMQWIGRRYVRAFNLRHHRSGSPWEGRFRSTVVEADRWGLACLRFVESPAAEGVSTGELLASSRQHQFHHASDAPITEHPVLWKLGNTPFEREAAYRRLSEEPLSVAHSAEIVRCARFGWALGSHEFSAAISEQTGRRSTHRPAGRPPKVGNRPTAHRPKSAM